MLFNSYEFILLFLPLIWLLYFGLKNPRMRLWLLAISSYFFYGYWNYKFIPLLLFSTLVDFFVGKKIGKLADRKKSKKWLLLSIVVNLGFLGFFKYANFFAENLALIGGNSAEFIPWDIVLPVGISFYTFQSMSYTIDIYRGNFKPYEDFLAFSTYVSFFPQLVAGPIVRHDELVPQLLEPSQPESSKVVIGLQRFILGLAKKVIIADSIGNAVDQTLIHITDLSTLEAWMCALGYTFQLYFDFSGYSDMAIGLGRLFGLNFPENFNSPYKSKSITEFWRRWHMTLSFWLRDYLYISLGGNRKGKSRTYFNLVMTMLLGGLWHGANWVFVVWGLFHGIMLAVERLFKGKNIVPRRFRLPLTFLMVVIGWVVFRSPDLEFALIWLKKLFSFEGGLYYKHFIARYRDRYAIMLVFAMFMTWRWKNTGEINYQKFLSKKYLIFFILIFVYILMELGEKSPFLYFQF